MMNNRAPWTRICGYSVLVHIFIIFVIALVLGNLTLNHQKEEMYVIDLQADFLQGSGHAGGGSNMEELFPEKIKDTVLEEKLKDIVETNHTLEDNVIINKEKSLSEASPNTKSDATNNKSGTAKGQGQGTGTGTGEGAGKGDGRGYGEGAGSSKGQGYSSVKGQGSIPFDIAGFRAAVDRAKVYPPQAVKRSITGTATVHITLDANGNCKSAHIKSSSGNSFLDKAAINAVYKACPYPNAQKEEISIDVPVKFVLN